MGNRKSKSHAVKQEPFLQTRNGKIISGIVGFIILVSVILGYAATHPKSDKISIKTSKGTIMIEVYPTLTPVTVQNFERLVKEKFYNGLTFHRVEKELIQGGDPEGNGMGGPGWTIPLEISPGLKNVRGAVAMARGQDPNSAGSQFYILKKDLPSLDGQYAVFGRVIKGMDVVDKIKAGDKMMTVKLER